MAQTYTKEKIDELIAEAGGTDVSANPEGVDYTTGPFLTSVRIAGTDYAVKEGKVNYTYTMESTFNRGLESAMSQHDVFDAVLNGFDASQLMAAVETEGVVSIILDINGGSVSLIFHQESTVALCASFSYTSAVTGPQEYKFVLTLNSNLVVSLQAHPIGPIPFYKITIGPLDLSTENIGNDVSMTVIAPKWILDGGFENLGTTIDDIRSNWQLLTQDQTSLRGFTAGLALIWAYGYFVTFYADAGDFTTKPILCNDSGVIDIPYANTYVALFDNNDIVRQFTGSEFSYNIIWFNDIPNNIY